MTTRKIATGDDTVLNMTPMIDVCFQLIVFFMLTLRFKSIDRRFECLLPNVGQGDTRQPVPVWQNITVKLFREGLEDGDTSRHYTKVRVGELRSVSLPAGPWPTDGDAQDARRREVDQRMAEVRTAIAQAWEQQGRSIEVKGEIKTPFPKGQEVPHGDVMSVLDAFVDVGISQVNFEGAASPLNKKQGGGWGFESP